MVGYIKVLLVHSPSRCHNVVHSLLVHATLMNHRCGVFLPSQEASALLRHLEAQGNGKVHSQVLAWVAPLPYVLCFLVGIVGAQDVSTVVVKRSESQRTRSEASSMWLYSKQLDFSNVFVFLVARCWVYCHVAACCLLLAASLLASNGSTLVKSRGNIRLKEASDCPLFH